MLKSSLLFLAACIQGVVAIPKENLVLDLNASAGVRLDNRQRVLSWTNQAKKSLARDFIPNGKGRAVPDSGMPAFIKSTDTRKFPVIRFRQQELINSEEDAFDHLTLGSGHTWYAAISIDELTARKKNVNSFFGNLRNSNETGGHYEGFWGVFRDDRSVYAGVRNSVEHTQGSANNPEVISRTKLEKSRFYIVAGRMGAGGGTVKVEVFVNEPIAEASGTVPVNKGANPSKMAIGQERDATNHPGDESFNGELARLLIYDKPHDPAEMKAVFEELRETYAINRDSSSDSVKTLTAFYSPAKGIGREDGVMRRDPSDIIKVGDLYHVWYTKGRFSSGYDATIFHATSPDGHTWTETGEALARGPAGSWDEQSVFTPNILVAKNKYWLFYTAVPKPFTNGDRNTPPTKTAIGVASADSPEGPWTKLPGNPILTPSSKHRDFDSLRVDDACLIVRDGRYWLYYKGRQWAKSPAQTKLGVAIADEPQGPYVKYPGNPLIEGNHEVLVWPQGKGVAAMIGTTGPKEITRSVQFAEDGLNFSKTHDIVNVPTGAGAWRPKAFADNDAGGLIEWGVHINQKKKGTLPFLERFELK